MRIGLIMPLAEQRGGVERMLINLLVANNESREADYQVAFLEDGPLVRQVGGLGYVTFVTHAGRLRDPAAYSRTARSLGRWMTDTRPDAVLSWAAKGHIYAGLLARRRRIPSAWFLHAIPDGHWMDRLTTVVPADVVLCCSTAAEAAQREMRPRRRTRVVNISVDLDAFDPDGLPTQGEARALLGMPVSDPLVVMVARLQRWKGVHVLIEAAGLLRDQVPSAFFVVVGGEHAMEPDYSGELESQIRSLGLERRVSLVGLQQNVPVWMQAADVVVHASFDEPAGAVIIEGMALGKAVIAARTAGPMEFVDNGENGVLTTPGDARELAAAIAGLLSDPSVRARLGRAARTRAGDFSAGRFASRVAEAMADIVAERAVAA